MTNRDLYNNSVQKRSYSPKVSRFINDKNPQFSTNYILPYQYMPCNPYPYFPMAPLQSAGYPNPNHQHDEINPQPLADFSSN